jgi:hypothetical protein
MPMQRRIWVNYGLPIRWLPTGRQKHLVLDPILTNPRKKKSASKKAASLIKTPQYCRVLRRQVPPAAKLSPGVGSDSLRR